MLMPGRSLSASRYRYGFNGKENDNEVKGDGNQQDYGMRVYDPRVGRFLSVDPLTKSYLELTPYQFAGNTPLWAIDLDGAEPLKANIKEMAYSNKDNHTVITAELSIKVQIINMSSTANSDLDMSTIQNTIKERFAYQLNGTHSAELPSSHKLNLKSKTPEVVPIYNQQYSFNIVKVNVQTEVVNSASKLTNDAVVVGIVDDLRPIQEKGKSTDPIGLTNDNNAIALLEANEVKLGKLNFEKSQSLVIHELGHTFHLPHDDDPQSVMYEIISKNIKFTDVQITKMIWNALGNWGYLWDKKKDGKELKLDNRREGDTGEQVEEFKTNQRKG